MTGNVPHWDQQLAVKHMTLHVPEALAVQVVVPLHLGVAQHLLCGTGGLGVLFVLGAARGLALLTPGALVLIGPGLALVVTPVDLGITVPAKDPATVAVPEVRAVEASRVILGRAAPDLLAWMQLRRADEHAVRLSERDEVVHA